MNCYNCPLKLFTDPFRNNIIGSSDNNWPGYIVKLDSTGNFIWDRFVPEPKEIIYSSDSGYIILMNHYENLSNQIGVIKIDSAGNSSGCISNGFGANTAVTHIDTGSAGILYNAEGIPGNESFQINPGILSFTPGCINVDVKTITNSGSISIYPNPSSGSFTIDAEMLTGNNTIHILNLFGEIIFSQTINLTRPYKFDKILAAGLYTLNIRNENSIYSRKLIISKN